MHNSVLQKSPQRLILAYSSYFLACEQFGAGGKERNRSPQPAFLKAVFVSQTKLGGYLFENFAQIVVMIKPCVSLFY